MLSYDCDNCGEILITVPLCERCGVRLCEYCRVTNHVFEDLQCEGDWCGKCENDG